MAYANTTRSTLRDKIRERIFDTFWSDDELNRYIDEALKVWNTLTGYNRQASSVTIPANTVFYSLNSGVTNHLIFLRAELSDTHLLPISVHDLDKMNRLWMCDSDYPIYVALIGLDHCIFYPISATDYSITIESVRKAVLPNADASYIQVGEDDIPSIIEYVHFLCSLKEGGAELNDGIVALRTFMKHAATYNSKLNKISVFRKMLGYGGQPETRQRMLETQTQRPAQEVRE